MFRDSRRREGRPEVAEMKTLRFPWGVMRMMGSGMSPSERQPEPERPDWQFGQMQRRDSEEGARGRSKTRCTAREREREVGCCERRR